MSACSCTSKVTCKRQVTLFIEPPSAAVSYILSLSLLQERIKAALARADMKVWELFRVGNNNLPDAPLEISQKDGDMSKTFEQGVGRLVPVHA